MADRLAPTRTSYPLKLLNMEHIPLLLYAVLTIKVLQIKVNKALMRPVPQIFLQPAHRNSMLAHRCRSNGEEMAGLWKKTLERIARTGSSIAGARCSLQGPCH